MPRGVGGLEHAMLDTVIHYGLDVWAFALIGTAATVGLHLWLKRRDRGGLSPAVGVSTLTVVAVAVLGAKLAGQHEHDRLRDQMLGFGPTYAGELSLMGHAAINESTPAGDPAYLNMIAAEKRWLAANPAVADIYTFRKERDGDIHLIVDSETDYDHDGQYDAEREMRTPIGEKYDTPLAGWYAALDGLPSFDDQPQTDRWGTWVSAYVPLRDADGRVEAAVGVDYDAGKWLAAIEWSRMAALGLAGVLLTIVLAAAALVTMSRAELAKRERLQRQLVDASRQAGMAEVATGVLHNVGNVLNNVTVSAEMISERVRNSRVAGVARAVDLMRDHDADLAAFLTADPKGRMLPDYLGKLSDVLASEQADMIDELGNLHRSLAHVKQIVASQQSLAKKINVIETFDAAEVIDEAVRLGTPARELGCVSVEIDAAETQLTSDRHQILQVLTNLIANAVKATANSTLRSVVVSANTVVTDGQPSMRFCVTDGGCGMTAEVMARLFTHGFTTRTDGHGFGLHHSALTAQNLGGTLVAHSDGPGRGATFTLTVPTEAAAMPLAA